MQFDLYKNDSSRVLCAHVLKQSPKKQIMRRHGVLINNLFALDVPGELSMLCFYACACARYMQCASVYGQHMCICTGRWFHAVVCMRKADWVG